MKFTLTAKRNKYQVTQNEKELATLITLKESFKPRQIQLFENENNILSLIEQKRGLKILKQLPIIGIIANMSSHASKHYQFIGDKGFGEIQKLESWKENNIRIHFNDVDYKLYDKYDGNSIRFYLFKGSEQVGLFDKKHIEVMETSEYIGDFNSDIPKELCMMIMTYIDVIEFRKERNGKLDAVDVTYTKEIKFAKPDVTFNDQFKAK